MRNKQKLTALIFCLVLLLPYAALAEELKEPSTNQTRPQRTTTNGQERTKRDRVTHLKRLAETQYNRTAIAIRRLAEMVSKIERYIKQLQDKGVDVSSAEASMAAAKSLKAEIEAMLSDLKAKHDSIDPEGTDAKKQVQAFMTAQNAIKKKLIEFHRALKDVVKQLRSLEQSARPTGETQ